MILMGRFAPDEYFHIYNRAIEERLIFGDDWDKARFIISALFFQGENSSLHFSEITKRIFFILKLKPQTKERHSMSSINLADKLNVRFGTLEKILNSRTVELVEFCLMPNHFHLILKEFQDGGISKYMQRLGDSFTKYFNARHNRRGHVFESRFNAVHVDSNEYLLPLSVYIHKNPYKLKEWRGREEKYPWSSFQDFLGDNRWGKFLNPSIILEQFNNGEDYKRFVNEYEPREELDQKYFIDS